MVDKTISDELAKYIAFKLVESIYSETKKNFKTSHLKNMQYSKLIAKKAIRELLYQKCISGEVYAKIVNNITFNF